jgi:hypothetical protein
MRQLPHGRSRPPRVLSRAGRTDHAGRRRPSHLPGCATNKIASSPLPVPIVVRRRVSNKGPEVRWVRSYSGNTKHRRTRAVTSISRPEHGEACQRLRDVASLVAGAGADDEPASHRHHLCRPPLGSDLLNARRIQARRRRREDRRDAARGEDVVAQLPRRWRADHTPARRSRACRSRAIPPRRERPCDRHRSSVVEAALLTQRVRTLSNAGLAGPANLLRRRGLRLQCRHRRE